jgi:aminoglycoside phosphotransferase
MTWVLLIMVLILPAVAFWLAFLWIPSPDEPPRWRTALASRLDEMADNLRHRHPEPTDPFEALRVQERLGAVADHVRALEVDPHTFARAERIIASQLAYDQLLAEACKMAGVEVLGRPLGDPQERFREEVELASRGWSW